MLAEKYLRRRYQEGKEEGRKEMQKQVTQLKRLVAKLKYSSRTRVSSGRRRYRAQRPRRRR